MTPTELNVWLYWAPPADPKGDPITGYEVQGKPIKANATPLIDPMVERAEADRRLNGNAGRVGSKSATGQIRMPMQLTLRTPL